MPGETDFLSVSEDSYGEKSIINTNYSYNYAQNNLINNKDSNIMDIIRKGTGDSYISNQWLASPCIEASNDRWNVGLGQINYENVGVINKRYTGGGSYDYGFYSLSGKSSYRGLFCSSYCYLEF